MRMLSGRLHWLTVGLALLVSAGHCYGQTGIPVKAAQYKSNSSKSKQPVRPAAYSMNPTMLGGSPMGEMPSSMAFQGPPPMDYSMVDGGAGCCDSTGCASCDSGGLGRMGGAMACRACGGGGCGACRGLGLGMGCGLCGGAGCGACSGQGLGSGCGFCSGGGCLACGWNKGCLLPGGLISSLLGSVGPYSEGPAAQHWFDVSVGTIAWARRSDFTDTIVSSRGISGPTVLSSNDLDLDKYRYGLAVTAAMQMGPGGSLEATYFGLNSWNVSSTVVGNADLFSVYSNFGVAPPNGFDDTDRSLNHTVSYSSDIHNGEINFRRRWAGPCSWLQGSWLAGIRYFDLDERFAFNATGENNNALANNGLRFFEQNTATRNQLTGFQIGGDLWMNVIPGVYVGTQAKGGIFGNHAEVETTIFANSIPLGQEFLTDGKTAFVTDLSVTGVYRMTYSLAFTGSFNMLYLDNVALAPENYNTRDVSNVIGGGAFTTNRRPFIDADGEMFYTGFGGGIEYTW